MSIPNIDSYRRDITDFYTDQLAEQQNEIDKLTERNRALEAIIPDIETLLWFCDKHMENVRAIKDRATEKELTGLKAHTRLREIFRREEEDGQRD